VLQIYLTLFGVIFVVAAIRGVIVVGIVIAAAP
jgi:hypothetical protein